MIEFFDWRLCEQTFVDGIDDDIAAVRRTPLYAQEPAAGAAASTVIAQWSIITAGFALAIAAAFGALGQSSGLAAAVEGIARNPSAAGEIRGNLILGLVLIESLVIYVLLISLILFFVVAVRRIAAAGKAGGAGRAGTADAPDVPAFGSSIPPLLPTAFTHFPQSSRPRPAAIRPFLPLLPVPAIPPIPGANIRRITFITRTRRFVHRIWIVRPSFLDLPGSKQISLIYH